MTGNKDRKASLLTNTDREWVSGEYDIDSASKQLKYERRKSVNSRTKEAIRDLELLAKNRESEFVESALSDISLEEWDRAIESMRRLHPDTPGAEHEQVREVAHELLNRADELEEAETGER